MSEKLYYDLSNATLTEFVDFLFNHETIPEPEEGEEGAERWYYHAEVVFEPATLIELYIRFFTAPADFCAQYTREQLEQGFWMIPGSCYPDYSAGDLIWYEELPFEVRANCVRAMFHLFEQQFALDALDTSVHMWWDALAYAWHSGRRKRSDGGEDAWMQDVMFETLVKILGLADGECQAAALHGLGHLQHPDTEAAIGAYLERNPELDAELRRYALSAARFEVM